MGNGVLTVFIPALLFQIYFLLPFPSFLIKYSFLLMHLSIPHAFLQTQSKKVVWPQYYGQVSLLTYFGTPCIFFCHYITLLHLKRILFLWFHSYKLLEARVYVCLYYASLSWIQNEHALGHIITCKWSFICWLSFTLPCSDTMEAVRNLIYTLVPCKYIIFSSVYFGQLIFFYPCIRSSGEVRVMEITYSV